MKRTELKKKTKNPTKKLEEKLDREYQDFFRELCHQFGITSEYSGKQMEVCHHHIEKCRSALLRYNLINFVPITNGEHTEISLSRGDGSIMNRVISKRCQRWVNLIEKLRYKTIPKDFAYYEKAQQQLEYMKSHKKELVASYLKNGYFSL